MRSPGHVIGHGWARVGTGGHGGHARAREGTGLAARREMGKEAPVETVRPVRPVRPVPPTALQRSAWWTTESKEAQG